MNYKEALAMSLSTESFISQEYNAFDFPRFFFPILNQVYRVAQSGTTKIDNPHILTYMVTGKLTEVGKVFGFLTATAPLQGTLLPIQIGRAVLQLWSIFKGQEKGYATFTKDKEASLTHNIYKQLIFNPDKLDYENPDNVLKAADDFCKGLKLVKDYGCKPIEERNLTLGEKNTLKLFRPKEIEADMKSAKEKLDKNLQKYPESKAKIEEAYKKVEAAMSDFVKYILANVKTGLIKQ